MHRSIRLLMTAVVAGCLFSALSTAQLKVDVALINVIATVTDDRGRYINDLLPEDFIVEEDGQPQKIVHLTESTDTPVSMGIVMDTSGSMEPKIATAINAVERFIRSTREDDDIFLMTFSRRPRLRQDFTRDRDKLAGVLDRIDVGGGTALYDAIDESLRKARDGAHKKKAILLLSDGLDNSSRTGFQEALQIARESELLVYCLGISAPPVSVTNRRYPRRSGPRTPQTFPGGPAPGSREAPTVNPSVLDALSEASGGKSFLLSSNWGSGRNNQINQALDEIAADLRNQYSIGYYPPHPLKDGKWHRIEIRMKNPHHKVRARKDYFGG